jgi:uncharacterized membrane-anchored protein
MKKEYFSNNSYTELFTVVIFFVVIGIFLIKNGLKSYKEKDSEVLGWETDLVRSVGSGVICVIVSLIIFYFIFMKYLNS